MPAHTPTHTRTRIPSHGVDRGSTGIPGVTRDATSGIYVPANGTEWTTFLAAVGLSGLGNPNSAWNCGEASGNLADSVGALTLTAAGTPTYQQAVPGWSRTGIQTVGVSDRFAAAAAAGPNPSTTSQLWVWFARATSVPAGARTIMGISNGATAYSVNYNNTPRIGNVVAGVTTNGTLDPGLSIQPIAVNYDRTGSRANVYTAAEKVVGTYSAGVVDGLKGFGANGGSGLASQAVYGFMYSGAGGEMSDANLKLLLQAMGYTIGWT